MTRRSASPNIAARSAAILIVLAITKSVTSAYNAGAQREAELRAGLRIGGDAARVIVGGARGQPGPERIPNPAERGLCGRHRTPFIQFAAALRMRYPTSRL